MDNEIKKKRYYIYENIDKFNDHNQIINLIKLKDCKFTENGNGIFLNISKLDPDLINVIYQILINTLDYKEETGEQSTLFTDNDNDSSINTSVQSEAEKEEKPKPQYKLVKPSELLLLKNYSKQEQEIITYSKKYNL